MQNLTVHELCTIIVLVGGVIGVFAKWLYPALKMGDRMDKVERYQKKIFDKLDAGEVADKLICKAMIELIDNRLTNNNVENLRTVKGEMMGFITCGKVPNGRG